MSSKHQAIIITCLLFFLGCEPDRTHQIVQPRDKSTQQDLAPEPVQCSDGTLITRPGNGPRPLLVFPCDVLPGEPCFTLDGRLGTIVRMGGHPHCDPTLRHTYTR